MKKQILSFTALLLALLLAGCAASAPQSGSAASASASASGAQPESAAPAGADAQAVTEAWGYDPCGNVVSATDALGRTVTVESPKRVAALIGSFADVWCLAGGKDTLVAAADDTWTQFELGLPETVVNLGGVKEPSAEALLAAQPDFVIVSMDSDTNLPKISGVIESAPAADVDLLPTLEQAGIPTAYFEVSTFEDYLAMLEVCTRVTGRPELYEQYGEQVRAQVDAAVARAEGKEGPSVLYLRATGSSCKVKNSENSVLGEMLAALGCVNIADSDASLLEELSMEAILAADPERIFIVMQGSDQEKVRQTLESAVLSNPAWQQLSAVKNGRVYYMDQQLYNLKPNARWGEAYEKLAEILYGEA